MADKLKPCPRAKSDMTPCILNDSWTAMSDDGHCVGCGIVLDDILTEGQQAQAERDAYRKLLAGWMAKRKEINDQPLQHPESPYQRRFRVEEQLAQIDDEYAEDAKSELEKWKP